MAARYLEERGWRILDRNWRAGHGEIDLVVLRDGIVAFVEVKSRSGSACGDPLESVTGKKRREIERVARAWLATRRPEVGERFSLRFDGVAVELAPGTPPRIRHVPDAWRIGDP